MCAYEFKSIAIWKRHRFYIGNNEKKPHRHKVLVLIVFFIVDHNIDETKNDAFAYATKDLKPSYPHVNAIFTTPSIHFD